MIEGGLFSTWNQTENHLMQKLSNNFAVAIGLDDASVCKYDLTTFIYNISQGTNRQRLTKSGRTVETKQWLTVLLSNGEMGLLERTNNNNGLKARAFEFEKQVTLSADHANEVKDFSLNNFGHLGREFVRLLQDSEFEDILEMYQEQRDLFLGKVTQMLPITERVADYAAVWLLTAEIVQEYMEINLDTNSILELLLEQHTETAKTFDMGMAIYNAICSYVVRNHLKFVDRPKETSLGFSDFCGSCDGIIEKNRVSILSTVFEKIVKDSGFTSVKLCLKELDRRKLLKRQRTDTYYSKRMFDGIQAKVIIINLKNSDDVKENVL